MAGEAVWELGEEEEEEEEEEVVSDVGEGVTVEGELGARGMVEVTREEGRGGCCCCRSRCEDGPCCCWVEEVAKDAVGTPYRNIGPSEIKAGLGSVVLREEAEAEAEASSRYACRAVGPTGQADAEEEGSDILDEAAEWAGGTISEVLEIIGGCGVHFVEVEMLRERSILI